MRFLSMLPMRGLRADRALLGVLLAFTIAFLAAVGMAALDQQRVIEAHQRLQGDTVPRVIRTQRLARNLEQLRQEGEHIFAASSNVERQQSLLLVTLIASHPSVLEDASASRLATEAEHFLGEAIRDHAHDEHLPAAQYTLWQVIANRLGNAVDDMSTRGIDLISGDILIANQAIETARYKLMAILMLLLVFILAIVLLVRRHLIAPLKRIDEALSQLNGSQSMPDFAPAALREIQAIEDAVKDQHVLLQQNEAVRRELETLAHRDSLTGLANRRYFMQLAEAELQRAQRYRRPVTVGMADLDHFKRLNDTYGHAGGDAVLQAFSDLLREALRQSDLVCRYGGEEFAFLFPEIGPAEAGKLAERLRVLCEAAIVPLPDGRTVRVTVSLGLADASACPIEIALDRADEALYEAKRQGRNRVVVMPAPEQPQELWHTNSV